ncbi:MAG: tetratricopeptide repeat protein [Deltaproteobacteria bacterium]|nr:tetratricopeptide repeat protein [Deltaproteobacteria bacterium]
MTVISAVFVAALFASAGPERETQPPAPGQRSFVSAQAYTHYMKGRIRELSGDLRGALDEYRLAVVHDALSPYLHLVISNVQARLLNLKGAISQAEAAAEIDPTYVDAHLQLGFLFRILGEFDAAEKAFQRAIRADPKRMEGYAEYSRVLLRQKKEKDAEAVFQMMMANLPDNPIGYYETGRIFYEKRILEKAVHYLGKALEKDPSHAGAAFTLASAYDVLGRPRDAAKVLEALQHFVSDDPELPLALGRLALKAGDETVAEQYFEHVRRFAWSEVDTRVKIAMAYLDEYRFSQALREMDDLYRQFPDKDAVLYFKGRVHEGAREHKKALEIYAKLPKTSDFYMDALVHGGYCLVKIGEHRKAIVVLKPYAQTVDNPASLAFHVLSLAWSEAEDKSEGIAFFETLSKAHPDWIEITEALSSLFDKVGRFDEAREVLERAATRPEIPRDDLERLLMALAMLYERAGRTEKGLEFARKVLDSNPDSPEALNFVGYTWAEQGKNLKEAEEMIRRALLYKHESGYVTDSLGWVLFQQGRYDQALDVLRRADRMAPEEPEILEHLAECLLKLRNGKGAAESFRKALKHKPEPRVRARILKRLGELEASR